MNASRRPKPFVVYHIGDIHFPQTRQENVAEHADRGVSANFVQRAAPKPLVNSIRTLLNDFRSIDTSRRAIAICGDLTNCGDSKGYRDCVDYLVKALDLNDDRVWRIQNVHVAIGNHDIDRGAANEDSSDEVHPKFKPAQMAWHAVRLGAIPAVKLRNTTISDDGSTIHLITMNSCLGCGEQRNLPEKLKAIIADACRARDPGSPLTADDFDLVGESLDTPAFEADAIQAVGEIVESLPPNAIPLILAHHNLLPQPRPRIKLYTEMLNGGVLRTRLSGTKRAAIYCHGHTHNTPIEIISDPRIAHSRVVSVSAPELRCGFNKIEIVYGRNCQPIGCIIHPVRIDVETGNPISEQSVRVRLHSPKMAKNILDELSLSTLRIIGEEWQTIGSVYDQITAKPPDSTIGIDADTVRDVVLDLEWFDTVEIGDPEAPVVRQQVRRVAP
jgi:3',5'-cyclic AMP phosphodiesterase CpdA